MLINYSREDALEIFHGKAINLHEDHAQFPYHGAFLFHEMRVRGANPLCEDRTIHQTIDWVDWIDVGDRGGRGRGGRRGRGRGRRGRGGRRGGHGGRGGGRSGLPESPRAFAARMKDRFIIHGPQEGESGTKNTTNGPGTPSLTPDISEEPELTPEKSAGPNARGASGSHHRSHGRRGGLPESPRAFAARMKGRFIIHGPQEGESGTKNTMNGPGTPSLTPDISEESEPTSTPEKSDLCEAT